MPHPSLSIQSNFLTNGIRPLFMYLSKIPHTSARYPYVFLYAYVGRMNTKHEAIIYLRDIETFMYKHSTKEAYFHFTVQIVYVLSERYSVYIRHRHVRKHFGLYIVFLFILKWKVFKITIVSERVISLARWKDEGMKWLD